MMPPSTNLFFSTQELLASGRASEALKETRGSMDSLANPATWGSQGPLDPRGAAALQD